MGLIENVGYLMNQDRELRDLLQQTIDRLVALESRVANLEGAPTATVSMPESAKPIEDKSAPRPATKASAPARKTTAS